MITNIENGIVKIVFVKSTENKADPFTKNTAEAIHKKHSTAVFIYFTACVV